MGISDKIKVATITTDETTTFIIEIKEMIALSLIIYVMTAKKYTKKCAAHSEFLSIKLPSKTIRFNGKHMIKMTSVPIYRGSNFFFVLSWSSIPWLEPPSQEFKILLQLL